MPEGFNVVNHQQLLKKLNMKKLQEGMLRTYPVIDKSMVHMNIFPVQLAPGDFRFHIIVVSEKHPELEYDLEQYIHKFLKTEFEILG